MLNPDGAARFSRRNAAHIDLNRDAVNLSSPESKLLKAARDSLNPTFGFNLHDQSIYYRAGRKGEQVALTFLAPAFDYEKNINGVRLKSMQLISVLHDSLSQIIPDRMGVYDDSFEPRAFGDNIQKWGTSTILIESGGYPDDMEKQYIRELNFITYIKALESILSGSYSTKTIKEYDAIPQNDRKLMSLIIRDLAVPVENQLITLDVGYLYSEYVVDDRTLYPSRISDVGDLRVNNGLEEFQADGMHVVQGKWFASPYENVQQLAESDWRARIREGYLGFLVKTLPKNKSSLPFQVATKKPDSDANPFRLKFAPGRNPTFILENEGEKWVVHNGNIFPMEEYIIEVERGF